MKTIDITSQVFDTDTNKAINFKVVDNITEENFFNISISDTETDIIKKYESYNWASLKSNQKVKVLSIQWIK
jgi:hypothetical protein